jgi:hypothetical protein
MTVYSIDPVGRGDFEHLEQMTRLFLPYSNMCHGYDVS